MPINFNKNIIFIHIPKCSGTRINQLFNLNTPNILYSHYNDILGRTRQHYPYYLIKTIIENHNLNIDNYYIFTIVRNPYYRFISAYNQYPNRCNEDFKKLINNMNIKTFALYLLNKIKIEGYDFFKYGSLHQFQPSIFYIEKNNPNINILKIENNYNNTIKQLCNKFNITYDNDAILNKDPNSNYDEILKDVNLKNIIYEIYKEDFEYFNYEK